MVLQTKDIFEKEGFKIAAFGRNANAPKVHSKVRGYCEPFCGMLGVYQHIPDLLGDKLQYLAGDSNCSVIKMWQRAQKGWIPPIREVSKQEFLRLAGNGKSTAVEKGYIGHFYGYRGKYFKPYKEKKNKKSRIKTAEKVSDIALGLSEVTFTCGEYTQFSNLKTI